MTHSDKPSISKAFRHPHSLAEAAQSIVELGRALDHARTVDQSHWKKIQEMQGAIERLSDSITKLTIQITEIRTKLAIYVGLGSAVGGGLISLIVSYFIKK